MGKVIPFEAVVRAAEQNIVVGPDAGSVPVVVEGTGRKPGCGCKRRKRNGGLVLIAGSALLIGLGLGMLRR